MKVKVTTGKGFGGCVRYVTAPKKSEFLGGTSPDPKSFIKRCAMLRAAKTCKTPVLHFSLSQPEGERLDDEKWQEVTSLFLKELGLADHDHIFARHTDTKHDHIHIVVSKISPDFRIWDERKSALRAIAAVEKIEQKLGLTITKTLSQFQNESGLRIQPKQKSAAQLAIQKRKAEEKRRTVGKIMSRQTITGEVVFRQNKRIIAKLNKDRTAIEVFSIDRQAIDFAIENAVRSGQIPLEIYGTQEFVEAATKRANELKIPTKNKELDMQDNIFITKGVAKMNTENAQLVRLKNRLDATDLNLKAGNISRSELDWRIPRHLKEWIADEQKRDRTITEFALIDLAKMDRRIKQEHANEVTNDLENEKNEENESQSEQDYKMKG